MSRLLRATPPQPTLSPPTVITLPAVPGTPGQLVVQTYGFAARARPGYTIRRFPLQGWEQTPSGETNGNPLPEQSISAGPTPASRGFTNFGATATAAAVAQRYAHLNGNVTRVIATLRKTGTPVDNLIAEIRLLDASGFPSATVLATSGPVAGSTLLGVSGGDVTFTFSASSDIVSPVCLVIRRDGAIDAANFYGIVNVTRSSPEGGSSTFNSGTGIWDVFSATDYDATTVFFTPFALQLIQQRRVLGPRPPQVVNPLPSQQQQNVRVLATTAQLTNQRRVQQRAARQIASQRVAFRMWIEGTDGAGGHSAQFVLSNQWLAQSFVAPYANLRHVVATIERNGSPVATVAWEIQTDSGNKPSGVAVAGPVTIDESRLLTSGPSPTVIPLIATLTPGVRYWLVAKSSNVDVSNSVAWADTTGIAKYAGGTSALSDTSGATWTAGTEDLASQLALAVEALTFASPMIGVQPPVTLTTTFLASPITVRLAARHRRNTEVRRFPLQGWDGGGAVDRLSGFAYYTRPVGESTGSVGAIGADVSDTALASKLVGVSGAVSYLDVSLATAGVPTDNVVVELRTDDGGHPSTVVLSSGLIPGTDLSPFPQFVRVALSAVIAADQTYWVVLSRDGAIDPSNFYTWKAGTLNVAPDLKYNGTAWGSLGLQTLTWNLGYVAPDGSKSFYGYKRNLGPFPPLLQTPLAAAFVAAPIDMALVEKSRRHPSRIPHHLLAGPQTFAQPPPVAPLAVYCLQPDRLARRYRRQLPQAALSGPTVLQTFDAVRPTLARTRPRHVLSALPLVIIPTVSTFVAAPVVTVAFATRDRRTTNLRRFPLQGWDGDSGAGPTAPGRYPNTILASAPSSYWRLNEAVGAGTAVDLIASNNGSYSGVTLGQPPLVTADPATSALFGASSDVAGLAGTLTGQTNWSFECLFRSPRSAFGRIFYQETGVNDIVQIRLSNGTITMTYRDDAGVQNLIAVTGRAWDDGGIHHLVVTRNGTAIRGVVDGSNVTTNVIGGGAQTEAVTTTIGAASLSMVGNLSDVAVYTRTLTDAEILAHYQAAVRGYPNTAVYLKRNLGPRPPLIQTAPTADEQHVRVAPAVFARRNTDVRRKPHWLLAGPATLAQPPPAGYAIFVTLAHARPRPSTVSVLRPPTVVTTAGFIASPISVTRVVTRPRAVAVTLSPPTALQVFSGTKVTLVRARPVATRRYLTAPTVIRVPSVEQRQQTIAVTLVRTRPRPTTRRLGTPTVLRTFTAGVPVLARIRPRGVVSRLPLVIAASTSPVETTISVSVVRTRPRHTTARLAPPTVLAVFSGATVTITRIRPRATRRYLTPPTVVRVPAVEQREQTIAVTLVRTRPRPTTRRLGGPTVLRTFAAATPTLAHTRPRRTRWFLRPPTVVRVPSVEQQEDTIRVTLVRARPRPTTKQLAAPTALQTFAGPSTHLVRTRPRATVRALGAPTVLETFGGATVTIVRTRPQPTVAFVSPAVVVAVPAVEQQEETVRVTLVRTRPRPTVKTLGQPQALDTFRAGIPTLARIRPRPTDKFLAPPTVVRVPSVEQREQTVAVTLVRIRPRQTRWLLRKPTVVRVPSVEQVEQTIRVALVRTRPRPTTKALFPPTVLQRPPVRPLVVSYLGPNQRRDWNRRFPNQGQRQRLVRETGTTVTNQLRDPFVGPRPPQIIDPLPNQRAQTVSVTLVAVRTRRELPRHVVKYALRPPTKIIPLPTQAMQTVLVKQTRIRPRDTIARLYPPVVVERIAYFAATAPLVRTRPRATIVRLAPPTIVRVPSVEQQRRTINVTLVRTRPRPQAAILRAPEVLATFEGPAVTTVSVRAAQRRRTTTSLTHVTYEQTGSVRVTVVRTRPRPTRSFLLPPTTLREFFGPVEEQVAVKIPVQAVRRLPHSRLRQTIVRAPVETRVRVTLTNTRPRAVHSTVRPPRVVIAAFVETHAIRTLAPGRRPVVSSSLAPPASVRQATFSGASVALVTTRPRATVSVLAPPTVVEPFVEAIDTTIKVKCVAVADRERRRTVYPSLRPVVVPSVTRATGVTEGYDIAASATGGSEIPSGATEGDARAATATGGSASAGAVTEGESIAAAGTDGEDRSL